MNENLTMCPAGDDPRLVGDPVNVITGANTDRTLDFSLPGPIPLEWFRYYDSSKNRQRRSLGWGHAHEFERLLIFDLDGMRYLAPDGGETGFPVLETDGASHTVNGLRLERVTKDLYRIHAARKPVSEFRFHSFERPSPVTRVFLGKREIVLRYGKDLRLESVIDSLGRWIEIRYDEPARRRLFFLHEEQGKEPKPLLGYRFDEAGNLAEGVDAYRNAFSYRWDAQNRMTAKTDRRGYAFLFDYDAQGRCVRSTGQDGVEDVRLRYSPQEGITEVTKGNGGKWTYFYDESKVLIQIIDPYGGVRTFKNDDRGLPVEEADPNGNPTKTVYDEGGNPVGKVSPFGRYYKQGDEAPNPLEHRTPASSLQFELGDLLPDYTVSMPTWKSESIGSLPDPLLRHFQIIPRPQPEPGVDRLEAEAKALDQARPPSPVKDAFGRVFKESSPKGSPKAWAYDKNGNLAAFRDRDHAVWKYEYASWNHLAKEIDPLGRETKYAYNTSEKLTEVVGPGGARSQYDYDLKDRLVRVKRHGVVREEYLYDSADNLIEKRAGDGRTLLRMEIGKGNQLKARKLASGENHTFAYDESGRYVEAATATSKTTFAYDKYSGERTETLRDGQGVKHAYKDGVLAATEILGKFAFGYQRKGADTLSIRMPDGKDYHIKLLGNGLVQRNLPNGSKEWAQYDRDGRALSKVATGPERYGQEWVRRYAYSDEGDLLEESDNQFGVSGYRYDAAHRLTAEVHPDGRESAYVHDAGGNLIGQPGLAGVSLLEGNRLGTANGARFAYDDRNHLALREEGNSRTEYGYDSRGFLTRIDKDGRTIWTAEYDPIGRRIRKTHLGKTWEYYWDSDRLMAEIDSQGKVRAYVYPDLFAMTPVAFVEYPNASADPAQGKAYFIFTNHLGAPILVEDDRGEPVWAARIEAYGNAIVAIGQGFHMPLRFPGHYWDAETGLHYNRFRYYSPELGRYLQSDPHGISGGLNLYAYAEGNPLRWVDVRGLNCPLHTDFDHKCQDCLDEENATHGTARPLDPVMAEKIVNGERRGDRLVGAHSAEIMNDPLTEVKITQEHPDGTFKGDIQRLEPDGTIITKTGTTFAPPDWDGPKIVSATHEVSNTPPSRGVRPRDGATIHEKQVDGVQWTVIKKPTGEIISSFPTGGAPYPHSSWPW